MGPLRGQDSKGMQEIGVQTRFFATRSPAHFKGLMKINKLTTQSCPVGSFKDSPPPNVVQLGPIGPRGAFKSRGGKKILFFENSEISLRK